MTFWLYDELQPEVKMEIPAQLTYKAS